MKRFISILLCVLMVVSVAAVGITVSHAALDPNMLYFDTNGTGWDMQANDKVGFYVFPLSSDVESKYSGWGGKALQGKKVDGSDTMWYYDPSVFKLEAGKQYKIIFTHNRKNAPMEQTYDLIMDTTCLGHAGYCDGTTYENPVDSSKSTLAAFWKGKDSKKYGPVLQISSIGNVVGTCPEKGKTPQSIFIEFLTIPGETGVTNLVNARKNVVEVGTKTEQKMIDDIGKDLGLTVEQVYAAFTDKSLIETTLKTQCGYDMTNPDDEKKVNDILDAIPATGVETAWNYKKSTLPHKVCVPGEPVQQNVTKATCGKDGKYDSIVKCIICGNKIEDLCEYNVKIPATGDHTPGETKKENVTKPTCVTPGSHDDVVYCTVCKQEISRNTVVDPATGIHTPGETKKENVVPPTCVKPGSHDDVVYCTVCEQEISRNTVEDAATGIHTPGEPVQENYVPATCAQEGSYDLVTYCTVCEQKLDSQHVVVDKLPHTIVHMDEVPATTVKDGMKEHYECSECHACFTDEEGKNEVDPETLVIKADKIRGDANCDGEFEIDDATTVQRVLAMMDVQNYDAEAANVDLDKDDDGNPLVDMIDVTLMQRVLAQMTTFKEWDAKHEPAA